MDGTIRQFEDMYGNKIYPNTHSDAVKVGNQTLTEYLENMETVIVDHLLIRSPNGTLFKIGATDEGKFELLQIQED